MSRWKLQLVFAPLFVLSLIIAGCKDQSSATDYTDNVVQPPPPAADVLQRRVDDAIAYTRDQRLMNTRDQAAWQIVHGLEAFGRDLKIDAGGETVGALDYIFQGNPLKGWSLRPGDKGLIALVEAGSKTGQGHPDQFLGYLSQCGVQLDDPVIVGGKTYHVRDLLTQAQWDIYDGMEASWTLMALTAYLPLDTKWKSKDGQDWSIERVVKMETAQTPGTGGCGDSHRMYAIALAVNMYLKQSHKTSEELSQEANDALKQTGKPPTDVWLAAQSRIDRDLQTVRENEQPDGTLSTGFFGRPAYAGDIGSRLYAAGHILEFLTVALTREQLSEDWVVRIVNRLCDLLDQTRGLSVECGMLYHGSHGLILYREKRWGGPTK